MNISQQIMFYCYDISTCFVTYQLPQLNTSFLNTFQDTPLPEVPNSESNWHSNVYEAVVKELQIKHSKSEKKVWSESEIQLLVRLRQEGLGWQQISNTIPGSNSQICKRKYERNEMQRKRWPKQLDLKVIQLFEKQKKSWQQIFSFLEEEWGISSRKKLNEIKQRYKLHLRSQISKQAWTMDEDIELLNKVNLMGKRWKKISSTMGNRTELQVKNRYYGTLLLIIKRVERSLEKNFAY